MPLINDASSRRETKMSVTSKSEGVYFNIHHLCNTWPEAIMTLKSESVTVQDAFVLL